jgi:hypothetical protein
MSNNMGFYMDKGLRKFTHPSSLSPGAIILNLPVSCLRNITMFLVRDNNMSSITLHNKLSF